MREIKFRVWDVRRNVLANVTSIMWLSEDEIEIDHDKNGLREPFQIHGDTAILEQFTGLHDKNGVEIFEGDILLLGDIKQRKTIIEYDQLRAEFIARLVGKIATRMAVSFWNNGEVIGNIHNNKMEDLK